MKRRSGIGVVLLTFIIVLLALAVIVGGCGVSGYNKAIRLDETVKTAWAQVENQLQRRFDLIPNLVETVKGYATHEQQLFTEIAQARTKYFQPGSRTEKVQRANHLEGVLSRLLFLHEKYPELKAQEGFLSLQDALEGTENRLAVERKRYNDAVKTLNTYRRSIFGSMFCGWAGVEAAEYFEPPQEARQAPKVKFDSGG